MDSHSRSASPREPIRPQHRPPSPPATPVAFDNRAFQHDEADPNHNDSFTSNGPQQNGHSKEPNGDSKTLEAVNLELINLTPKNGNAKQKKDVEVDMNATNPYDEYFVPVNEHRKYMRGEKLYVTADKRGEKGGCKRPLCWTLLGLIVATIVAVIVLAATGVLFSNSPTTLEQYNTSISSARALGGLGPSIDNDHDHHDHEPHEHTTDISALDEHGPTTHSEDDHDHSLGSEDSSLYVPRTVEGELKIDNEEFTSMLQDPDSNEYRDFAAAFTAGLKQALFDRQTLENGDNEINVEIVGLRQGSIIVTYRIHWKPKYNAPPTEDLLTASTLATKLNNHLDNSGRMINVYHVAEDKMSTRPVLDVCQINKNDCEYGCEFNEMTLDFTCTCPHGQILDMTNPKKCMILLETPQLSTEYNESTKQNEIKVLTIDSNPSTTKTLPDEEKPATESVTIESKPTMHEATTESDDNLNFSHIFGHSQHDDHETKSPNLEPSSEEKPDQATTPKPEPEPTSEPQPNPEPTVEPEPSIERESAVGNNVKNVSESQPTGKPEPVAEPEPNAEPEPSAEPEPTAEPQPLEESEPALEPVPSAEPQPIEEFQTSTKPQSEVELQPVTEQQPTTESHPTEVSYTTIPVPKAEPQPTAEPGPALQSETPIESQTESHSSLDVEQNLLFPQLNNEQKPTDGSQQEPTAEPPADRNVENSSESMSEILPTVGSDLEHISRKNSPRDTKNPNVVNVFATETTMHTLPISDPKLPSTHIQVGLATESYVESRTQTTRLNDEEIGTTTETHPVNIFSDHNLYNNPAYIFSENNESEMNVNSTDKNGESIVENEMTTRRISISEPNIINEPSYEPKPEIVSILSDNKEHINNVPLIESEFNESTTETHDWLEDNGGKIMKDFVETEYKTTSESNSVLETETKNILNQETESSAIKSFNNEFVSTTTTAETSSKTENGDLIFDGIAKDKNMPIWETTKYPVDVTTMSPVSMVPVIDNQDLEDQKKIISIETTTSSIINTDDKTEQTYLSEVQKAEKNSETDIQNQDLKNNEESKVSSVIEEKKPLDLQKSTQPETTMAVLHEKVTEYSISNQHDSGVDKKLIEALQNKNQSEPNETYSTESNNIYDEGTEVTFDTINSLYNRSSKSIDNHNKSQVIETKTNEILRDATPTTTESDWLSETATEINYNEAINKIEKQNTTETSETKEDEALNHDLTKDDFEPDYLNNMSSNNNKMSEQDIPIYGMTHDYDTEDSRFKRVNKDKETHTEVPVNESNDIISKESSLEVTSVTNKLVETTTVSEYIYKIAEKTIKTPEDFKIAPTSKMIEDIIITTAKPAAVWEEPEEEKDLSVKELPQKVYDDSVTSHPVTIHDMKLPVTTVATIIDPDLKITSSVATIMSGMDIIHEDKYTNNGNESLDSQNTTQMNNLNVTIYEIPSHSENNTSTTPNSANMHSSEYEYHETDMNPFLPEVENNKILVKKLQEGHEIEPINLNDTQNENAEEHSISPEDLVASNDIHTVSSKTYEEATVTNMISSSTEADAAFNNLPMKTRSEEIINNTSTENVSPRLRTNEDNSQTVNIHEKETLPISTFLMDTDDLDINRDQLTEQTTVTRNTLNNEGVTPFTSAPVSFSNNNEYLSVVPIQQERAKENEGLSKSRESENIQQLNYVSDSPKKSERTLDDTKFDSDINNEA